MYHLSILLCQLKICEMYCIVLLPRNAVDPYIVLSCTIDEVPLAFSVPSCNRRASCLSIAEVNAAFSFCFDSVRVAFVEQEFEHLSRPARQTCRGRAAPNTAWAGCAGSLAGCGAELPTLTREGDLPTREELTS